MSDLHIHIIQPLPKPEKRPTRQNALVLWAVAALGLVVSSFISSLSAPLLGGMNPHVQLLISNLAYYLPFVVLPVFLLARRTPGLYEAYRPNPISLFNTISVVVLAVLGVFFVNDIIVVWSIPFEELGWNIYSAGMPAARNVQELMLSVITIAVLPAICEEFLFRGAILPAFEGYGTKHAMWISSLLFMLIHGSILGSPTQIILGMILSCVVIWTDSIYAGLIYHTVHNATAVVLQYMQTRLVADADAIQNLSLLEAIGGVAGLVELALGILFSAALILFTLKMFRLRGQLRGITAEPRRNAPLRRGEKIALALGALFCAVLYVLDLIGMLGV